MLKQNKTKNKINEFINNKKDALGCFQFLFWKIKKRAKPKEQSMFNCVCMHKTRKSKQSKIGKMHKQKQVKAENR